MFFACDENFRQKFRKTATKQFRQIFTSKSIEFINFIIRLFQSSGNKLTRRLINYVEEQKILLVLFNAHYKAVKDIIFTNSISVQLELLK